MKTQIKAVKSIGLPPLYDLCAAGALMQHLAPDPSSEVPPLALRLLCGLHRTPKAEHHWTSEVRRL